jgi:hypothetical protein
MTRSGRRLRHGVGSRRWSAVALAVVAVAGFGTAVAQSGSGSGSDDPGTGSGSGSGADPGSGSASISGSGSGSGAGSGSARIIQIPTDANAPQVSAAAAPTVVRLGGKFTVFITATFADGVEVNLREPVELGSAFEVRRKVSEDRVAADGRHTREWQLEVSAWELGDLVMPGIAITFTAFGRAGQVQTNQIRLQITGVLGDVVDDPKALRGDAPPSALLSRDWFWLWIGGAAGCVVGGLVGLLIYLHYRNRRQPVVVGWLPRATRRVDTTSARALARLLEIEQSGALDRDTDRKQGYASMSEVIRDYLGSRYHIEIVDLTSNELLGRLADRAPAGEHGLVERWLERCDIVKYGGLRATPADAHGTLEDARALIASTTNTPLPAASSPAQEAA